MNEFINTVYSGAWLYSLPVLVLIVVGAVVFHRDDKKAPEREMQDCSPPPNAGPNWGKY